MLKRILFICLILICSFLRAQKDSIKGNPIHLKAISKRNNPIKKSSAPAVLGDVVFPKISFGAGMLSFHGDLYAKHYQAPWTGRIGYDLNISQRLTKSLQLNFNVLFGKLGANEWINGRQENFQSEIRSGGINVMYDFGNFIPDQYAIRPWISVGINSLEFLSKTDLYDKYGNQYYYWSDGSIKNIDESAPTASLAVNLNRDYVYETDIRERNKDGFGKYQEQAWAFPVGAGALMKVTDRIDFKLGFQYYFTTTDYIDGITNNSIGTRTGNKQKDNFVYTSFALQYDLIQKKKRSLDTLLDNYFNDSLLVINDDNDEDGVKDWDDKCHGTPKGISVDKNGCPLDDDKDGIANHEDDELESPQGVEVDANGVTISDEHWQNWYNTYMDSGQVAKTEVLENFYAAKKDSTSSKKQNALKDNKIYTVELVRYNGPVPDDEMAYLLSIGDVESTVLPNNSTVLYTAGNYSEIQNAIKRKDEFIAEGLKESKVGYFKNGDFISLSNNELKQLLASSTKVSSATDEKGLVNEENEFAKGEIVYRVQLGAYKNRISKNVFKNAGKVLELKTDDNYFHYASKGFSSIKDAANSRADLVLEGYSDAFITAYKDGKRIPMNKTNATMETNEKENVDKIESFSSVDKSLVSFKIQLGALRRTTSNNMEEKIKDIENIEKQSTISGMIRFTAGSFSNYSEADKYRQELVDKGFIEAFVIAVFKGEIISIQEAQELLK